MQKSITIKEAVQTNTIQVAFLECIIMPNGEIISRGKTIGWFKDFEPMLITEVK